mgnify:CR=1 FL=1
MKTYAPKGLHGAQLRDLMADLHASPVDLAKYLHVTERSVWRWLADGSAPFAVLACLWHESPSGREASHLDVGNALVIERGLARSLGDAMAQESARLARVLAISHTGAANEPLLDGPLQSGPAPVYVRVSPRVPVPQRVLPALWSGTPVGP